MQTQLADSSVFINCLSTCSKNLLWYWFIEIFFSCLYRMRKSDCTESIKLQAVECTEKLVRASPCTELECISQKSSRLLLTFLTRSFGSSTYLSGVCAKQNPFNRRIINTVIAPDRFCRLEALARHNYFQECAPKNSLRHGWGGPCSGGLAGKESAACLLLAWAVEFLCGLCQLLRVSPVQIRKNSTSDCFLFLCTAHSQGISQEEVVATK